MNIFAPVITCQW